MHKIRSCLSRIPKFISSTKTGRIAAISRDKQDDLSKKAEDNNKSQPPKNEKPKDTDKTDNHLERVVDKKVPQRKPLRWGIAPVSLIAEEFVTALNTLPKDEHTVIGCAASYRSQAETFALKFNLPTIHTSFKSIAKCKDIDAVYVSPLNPFHLELCRLMLDNGKHVLCEVPMCLNEDETIQLVGNAQLQQRFLMEAMWPRFTPAYQFIRQQIRDGVLGDMWEVNCSFGLPMSNVDRIVKHSLGGGVAMNFGPHVFQLATWAFRMTPYKIHAVGKLNNDGVDVSTHVELDYGCGRMAVFSLSYEEEYENVARIKGSNGTMTVLNITEPDKVLDNNGQLHSFSMTDSKLPYRNSMILGASEVRNCLENHKYQSDLFTHSESLINARICDKVRQQLGVIFKCDKNKNARAIKN